MTQYPRSEAAAKALADTLIEEYPILAEREEAMDAMFDRLSRALNVPTPRKYNCIIAMQDDGYVILGPFSSMVELGQAGERWQAEHSDDPRWQAIYLADPHAAPTVIGPNDGAS